MDGKTLLIALAIEHRGNWKEIYEALKSHQEPSEDALAKAEALNEGLAITILDKGYPERLRACPQPPFVLFKIKEDEGAPDLEGPIDYLQTIKHSWGDYERTAMEKVTDLLRSLGRKVCFSKDCSIHVRNAGEQEELVLATSLDQEQSWVKANESVKIAAFLADDGYWMKVLPQSVQLTALAFFASKGKGTPYLLPNEYNNELIANGATTLPVDLKKNNA